MISRILLRYGYCKLGGASKPIRTANHKDFFAINKKLSAKTKDSTDPHFIFLEGLPGSGKFDIVNRLSKYGYTTISLPFIEEYKETKSVEKANDVLRKKFMDEITSIKSQKNPIKENVIFATRSPLSIKLESDNVLSIKNSDLLEEKRKLKEVCENLSVVWCQTDPIIIQQRIQGRALLSNEENKELRKDLNESKDSETVIIKKNDYYQKLLEDKIFDDFIYSTSVKQAVASIFNLFNIVPDLFKKFIKK
eukprot:TRINITY_DN8948_c0_g1_i3.p1 TRINITY_DN8948_c0_g1~~TRINITY_DN8948_c0_g1_i3.p1  ORF type:complete len:250 (+),score=49.66 TRINITY_DN8948_c0_g1_i3:47-796(+)